MKPIQINSLKTLSGLYRFIGVTIVIVGVAGWVINLITQNMTRTGFGTVVLIDVMGLLAPIAMGLVVFGLGQLTTAITEMLMQSRDNNEMLKALMAQKK